MESTYNCRQLRESDEEEVDRLIASTFPEFLGGKYWNWKYKQNPHFDYSLAVVAEENGEIIGCNQWLLRDFKLTRSLDVKAILGGDIAVKPEHQGKGVGKALMHFLRSSEAVESRKPALIYMFADPNLSKHFHTPIGKYIPAPSKTVSYMKVLKWRKIKENATSLSQRIIDGKTGQKLTNIDLNILFKIRGCPPLPLRIDENGVVVDERVIDSMKKPDITVTADLAALAMIRKREKRKWNLLKVVLMRRLRIGGKLSKMLDLYRNLWVLEELFKGKIA